MKPRKQKGHLLIEVLITILLISVGATGLMSAQLKVLRLSHDAQLISDVSNLNTVILEQFRSHPDLVGRGRFDLRTSTDQDYASAFQEFPVISDSISRFRNSGANFRIEIDCETNDFTVCEVCYQNIEPSTIGLLSTGENNSISRCNRQIIL